MFSNIAALFALFFSAIAVGYGITAVKYVRKFNKTSVTLREITRVQTELTEHADSIRSLHDSLKKLRARIGMRRVREERATDGDGLPDPKTDPDGWKKAMRLRIHAKRFS